MARSRKLDEEEQALRRRAEEEKDALRKKKEEEEVGYVGEGTGSRGRRGKRLNIRGRDGVKRKDGKRGKGVESVLTNRKDDDVRGGERDTQIEEGVVSRV